MDSTELACFIGRARRMFRGPMDEELFALARRAIAALDARDCMTALDAYALDYGGETGRFLPARFLEYARIAREQRLDAERLAARLETTMTASEQRIVTALEWSRLRQEIRDADDETREAAISSLEAAGWRRPEGPIDGWPHSWVLAVSDIVADRGIDGLTARAFWARCAPLRGSGRVAAR